MDLSNNVNSTIDVPPEIDAALNHTIKAYNLRAPLADLIYANAYDYLMEGRLAGFYLGLSKVQGHRLAFPMEHLSQLEDSLFTFVVPEKAEKVNLRPVAAPVRPKKTKMDQEDAAMQMMTRKKLMPKTRIVLLSMEALGGLLLVNPGNTLLSTDGEPWAASLGAQPGVGTSSGAGGVPVATPRGLCAVIHLHPLCSQLHSKGRTS
jgi:hypothetical protein